MQVEEFRRADGSSPFRAWFEGLPAQAAAKVAVAVGRLRAGHRSAIKWFDGIGEYRIAWGPGYRIYLLQDGRNLILLLGGGTKQRQRLDIIQALKCRAEYGRQKREELPWL